MDEMTTRQEFRPRDTAQAALDLIDEGLAAAAAVPVPDTLLADLRQLRFERTKEAVDRLLGPDVPAIWTPAAGHYKASEAESRPEPISIEPISTRDRNTLLLVQMAGRRGLSAADLAAECQLTRGKAYHSLDRLMHAGQVRKVLGRGRYVAVEEADRD